MIRKVMLCLVLLFFPSISSAAIINSVDRATFQAAVVGGAILVENFDSLAVGTILGVTPDVTYSASGGSPIVTDSYLTSTNPNGLGSTSVGFFLQNETATFLFNSAITAFALDINTFAPADGAYQATLNTGDVVNSIFEVFPSTSTGQFLGFTSDTAFTQVTIAAISGYAYTLDTLVYGDASAVAPVPEPATTLLIGAGLVGLVGARIRRKKK